MPTAEEKKRKKEEGTIEPEEPPLNVPLDAAEEEEKTAYQTYAESLPDPDDADLAGALEVAETDTAQARSRLSEELQEAIRIAEGTEKEPEKFAAGTVGWSALAQAPFLAEYAFGAPKRARQQRRALESEVPQGLSQAQEQAFTAQESGLAASETENRLRQQALEASKGEGVSARDLQRTRDAMRKQLLDQRTKVGLTKTITDITMENQQEQQRQKDLDSLAQFQTQYFRNLIGTPLAQTIEGIAEFQAKRVAFRAAPDVATSIEKLKEQGVSDDDIAGMMALVLAKTPEERNAYLADIATHYASLADEGAARAAPEEAPKEEVSVAAAQEAKTASPVEGEDWELPGNPPGTGLEGPFTLYAADGESFDKLFKYYWDNEKLEYIAFPLGGSNMTHIERTNEEANQRLQKSHNLWREQQQQGE